MKTFTILILFLTALLTLSCVTSEKAAEKELIPTQPIDVVSDEKDYYRELSDFLRRVPGVYISGTGNNQRVIIRGISSINSGVEPLFLIDGLIAGTTYSEVNNRINVRDIEHVRVLKGSDAAMYGVRGGNGVVMIVTKK